MHSTSEDRDPQLENLLKKASSLSKKDLMSVLSIKNNPLSILIIKKYTKNEKLDAKELIQAFHNFTNTRNLDEKLRFIFGLYDSDGDEYISNIELFELLKQLNKGIIEDWKIQNIVDKTFSEVGEYTTKISYEQFKNLITKRLNDACKMFNCSE